MAMSSLKRSEVAQAGNKSGIAATNCGNKMAITLSHFYRKKFAV